MQYVIHTITISTMLNFNGTVLITAIRNIFLNKKKNYNNSNHCFPVIQKVGGFVLLKFGTNSAAGIYFTIYCN